MSNINTMATSKRVRLNVGKDAVIVTYDRYGDLDTVSVNDRLVNAQHKIAKKVYTHSETIYAGLIPPFATRAAR